MNKKQFEHIESKFREAADNFQPPLNEEAWQKMDQLLDQEFNGNRRRRGGFWITSILLLLFLTGGVAMYFYYSNPVKPSTIGNKQLLQTPPNNNGPRPTTSAPALAQVVPAQGLQTPVAVNSKTAEGQQVNTEPRLTGGHSTSAPPAAREVT